MPLNDAAGGSAEPAAGSGNLKIHAPIGDTTIGTNGKCDRIGVVVQIQDGKVVPME